MAQASGSPHAPARELAQDHELLEILSPAMEILGVPGPPRAPKGPQLTPMRLFQRLGDQPPSTGDGEAGEVRARVIDTACRLGERSEVIGLAGSVRALRPRWTVADSQFPLDSGADLPVADPTEGRCRLAKGLADRPGHVPAERLQEGTAPLQAAAGCMNPLQVGILDRRPDPAQVRRDHAHDRVGDALPRGDGRVWSISRREFEHPRISATEKITPR